MGLIEKGQPKLSTAEEKFINSCEEQLEEETAEGEAFFDNVSTAEAAVLEMAAFDSGSTLKRPPLIRSGMDHNLQPDEEEEEAATPQQVEICIPDCCDMDADFGEISEAWGDE